MKRVIFKLVKIKYVIYNSDLKYSCRGRKYPILRVLLELVFAAAMSFVVVSMLVCSFTFLDLPRFVSTAYVLL